MGWWDSRLVVLVPFFCRGGGFCHSLLFQLLSLLAECPAWGQAVPIREILDLNIILLPGPVLLLLPLGCPRFFLTVDRRWYPGASRSATPIVLQGVGRESASFPMLLSRGEVVAC